MTRARNSANLASQGNLFVDIANDRTGIGSVVPAQNLHVAGTAGFHADTTFVGDAYNTTWDRSQSSLKFTDNARIRIGDDNDLQLYHDSNNGHSYIIKNSSSGLLLIQSNDVIALQTTTGENMLTTAANGAVNLLYDHSSRLQTTTYGVNVTGTTDTDGLVVSGVATVTTMNVTGVLTYDDVTSIDSIGIITARSNIDCNGNLDVAGTSNFVGDATFNGGAGAVSIAANSDIRLATGSWTGDAYGKIQQHANRLYLGAGSNADPCFVIRYSGTDRIYMTSGGTFYPVQDSNADLGKPSIRWANGYFDTLYGDGSNLTGLGDSDKIEEGNSSVEVIDTGTGKIDVIADGSYVSRFQKVNGNRTYMLVGNPQAVSNDYGTNNGHLIVLGNASVEPATLRLFGWGPGLSDGTVNNRIEFASHQSGSGGQTFAKIESVVRGSSDNSSDLTLHTASSATVSEKVRITSTGRFGIGTQSPSKTLHVHGESGSELPVYWIRAGSSVGGYLYSDGGGSGIVGGDGVLANTGIYLVTDTRIDFRVNGSERLRIDSSGHLHTGYTTGFGNDHVNILASDGGGISIAQNNSGNATSGTVLGSLSIQGYLNTQTHTNAEVKISGIAAANHTGSSAATDMVFYTKPSSTGPGSAPTEALRIDSSGRLLINRTASRAISGDNAKLQIENPSSGLLSLLRTSNDNGAAWLAIAKSRSAAGTVCQAGDQIGGIAFTPHDGTDLNHHAAEIRAYVDTGIGSNDTPGYLSFHTNIGASTTTEKLRITSGGKIGVNYAGTPPSETMMISSTDSTTGLSVSHLSGGNRYGFRLSTLGGTNKGLSISPFFNAGYTEALRIDQNGKVIVASGTLHSTRVLARFGIDCHGMNIFDGVGTVANYGMAFYNDPNTNYANGIGFFNDDGQTCGGYIVHQDKGGSNVGDIIMATAATANAPVERLRIESDGNIKQNLTSPSGTSPFQNSHWYDLDGGNYTLTYTDHNSLTAVRTSSGGLYTKLVYKRVRMSKNCDIEFELSGNSPSNTYRHVGFILNGNGTAAPYDRLVFRSRPASTSSNQIRIDKIDSSGNHTGFGFDNTSSNIPTFFDGTERHILIQLRDRLVNVIVDGVVVISQKTNADFANSVGWFGFSIYEGGENAQITIRNLTIKNKFIQPHWLARASGVNASVSNQNPFPYNITIKSSSDMSNSSHYNNSTYRFNVPISGMYYCFFRVYRNGGSGSEVAFYVNGSVRNRFRPQPGSGDYIFAGSALIQLLKGEYIDIRAFNGGFDRFYGNSDSQFSTWGGHLLDGS